MFSNSYSSSSRQVLDPPSVHVSASSGWPPISASTPPVRSVDVPDHPHLSMPLYRQYEEPGFEPLYQPSALPPHSMPRPEPGGMRAVRHHSVQEFTGRYPAPPPHQHPIFSPHPHRTSSYSQFAFNPPAQPDDSTRNATTGFHTCHSSRSITNPPDAEHPLYGPSTKYARDIRPITRNPKVHPVEFSTSSDGRNGIPSYNHDRIYASRGPAIGPATLAARTDTYQRRTTPQAHLQIRPTNLEMYRPSSSPCWENPAPETSITQASYVFPVPSVDDERYGDRPRSPASEAYLPGLDYPRTSHGPIHSSPAAHETVMVSDTLSSDIFAYASQAAQTAHHDADYHEVRPTPRNATPFGDRYRTPNPQATRATPSNESAQSYSTGEVSCPYEPDDGQASEDEAAYLPPDHYAIETQPHTAANVVHTSAGERPTVVYYDHSFVGGARTVKAPYGRRVAGTRGPGLQLLTTSQQYLQTASRIET